MTCTVGETEVYCGSAVGAWSDQPPSYYGSWYYYVVENQDSNGNLSGHYEGEDYDGPAPLSGHFDPSTGRGWWTVYFDDEWGAYSETDYLDSPSGLQHPDLLCGCVLQLRVGAVFPVR